MGRNRFTRVLSACSQATKRAITARATLLHRVATFAMIAVLLTACFPTARPTVQSQQSPAEQQPGPSGTLVFFPEVGNQAPEPTPQPSLPPLATEPAAPVVAIEGLFNLPDNVNPLTGLPVDDPSRLERRPVMVKVSNFPRTGRPHAGLSFADLVFEYYIGYGLNRFMGVYLGQDSSQVGPVRSGRLVDAQLAEMYQSLLFYGNADPQVDEIIEAELGPRALSEKNIPSPPKYRIGKPVDETTLFVNTAELSDYYSRTNSGSNTRRDLRGMLFDDIIHPENQPASKIGVQFWTTTRGEWHYDAERGQYLRWIEEIDDDNKVKMIPLVDRLNDQQLAFSNIIILYATYIEYAPTLHDIRIFDNPTGKRALFFRDGVIMEGTWKSVSNGRPIQFFNSWGLPMQLKQGNTWIVITGDRSTFEQKETGWWELRFDLP